MALYFAIAFLALSAASIIATHLFNRKLKKQQAEIIKKDKLITSTQIVNQQLTANYREITSKNSLLADHIAKLEKSLLKYADLNGKVDGTSMQTLNQYASPQSTLNIDRLVSEEEWDLLVSEFKSTQARDITTGSRNAGQFLIELYRAVLLRSDAKNISPLRWYHSYFPASPNHQKESQAFLKNYIRELSLPDLQYLLENGFKVAPQDTSPYSLVSQAIYENDIPRAKILLENGANIESKLFFLDRSKEKSLITVSAYIELFEVEALYGFIDMPKKTAS